MLHNNLNDFFVLQHEINYTFVCLYIVRNPCSSSSSSSAKSIVYIFTTSKCEKRIHSLMHSCRYMYVFVHYFFQR